MRNARLDANWAQVERSTMSIAGRVVNSLITTQGVGDLYRIYATAKRDGVDFNLTFIPEDFRFPHREEFDNDYMVKLYTLGYQLAVKGLRGESCPRPSSRRPGHGRESTFELDTCICATRSVFIGARLSLYSRRRRTVMPRSFEPF
jgi:hypothetical protein